MKGKWEQVGSEHFLYRKNDENNTVYGEISKKPGGYSGRYLNDGVWKVIPDLFDALNTAKVVVEGALQTDNVATR